MTRKCYTATTHSLISVLSNRSGYISEIRTTFQVPDSRVTLIIKHERTLQVGSKLISIHGQKSVISAIIPDGEMPKSALTGDTPDLIGSAESYVSRFTLGQIREGLQKGGGDVYLENYPHPVFWGTTFYFLLNHFAEDKLFTYKTNINLSRLSQQPLKGKAKFGGLRLGMSELFALSTFGMSHTIYNKYITESDGTTLYLCDTLGCLHEPSGIENELGHHALSSGSFMPHSFSVKRLCEDYAVCGIEIALKRQNPQSDTL